MWLDATNHKLYVRTFDNRKPQSGVDFDIMVDTTVSGVGNLGTLSLSSQTFWMQGVTFMGGQQGAFGVLSDGTHTVNVFADDCHFLGGSGYGSFSFYGGAGLAITYNCVASYSEYDGFNWHGLQGADTEANCPIFHEINCVSLWAGWNGALTNNGSTCHENTRGSRTGGLYLNGQDRTLHDIQDVKTWNLGCRSTTRRAAARFETPQFLAGLPATQALGLLISDVRRVFAVFPSPRYAFRAVSAKGGLVFTQG